MALQRAELSAQDLDCIVCASGCPEQSFPCTAALLQRQLGLGNTGIAAFDINASCLSFVTALDTISYLVDSGRYKRVLLVSSEICAGVNWDDPETGMLFGDAAAAAIIEQSEADSNSVLLASAMETYGEASHLSQCLAGGNRFRPEQYTNLLPEIMFTMEGKGLYKMAAQYLPPMLDRLLNSCNLSTQDIDVVIPHQASMSAMALIRRNLGFSPSQWIDILETHGNNIAASIPLALHEAVISGKLKRGQTALLLGTAAGFSIGALLFRY